MEVSGENPFQSRQEQHVLFEVLFNIEFMHLKNDNISEE